MKPQNFEQKQVAKIQKQISRVVQEKVSKKRGLMSGFEKLEHKHKLFFSLVISICIVLFWRGTWNLVDEYLVPDNFLLSNIISILIALSVIGVSDFLIKKLAEG